jgi:hypothetical protein
LVRAVAGVALAGTFAILFGADFFTPQLVTVTDSAVPAVAASPSTLPGDKALPASAQAPDDPDAADPGDGFTDLYGNEVSDAIATYTFDQSGSLYELHSPQTELPRLGIPKS